MSILLPYGKGTLTFEPEGLPIRGIIHSSVGELKGGDEQTAVWESLHSPIGSPRLCELARTANRILIITSDHTRPVPSAITLPLILEEIHSGNPNAAITILVATGMHRAPTQEELRAKFGPAVYGKYPIMLHNSADASRIIYKGQLPSELPLYVNAQVDAADLVIAEGFIEPHFFAGFSGGRKSILPGIAGRQSVMANHCAQLIASPLARTGILAGNPIHEDMQAAARLCGLAFIVNVVIDSEKKIVRCFAGHPEQAHAAGCAFLAEAATVPAVLSDIVVTTNGGYPLDQDIYQTVKGMSAAESCVRPGGVIILAAECVSGSGGEGFVDYFRKAENPAEVERRIMATPRDETPPDQWQAQILARILKKAHVIMVSDERNKSTILSMKMGYASTLSDAMTQARVLKPTADGITVIPDGVSVIFQEAEAGHL